LRVGPLAIGMARAHALHAYPYVSHRGSTDYFCLTPAGVSVSYPTRALLQALSPAVRRRVRGRIVLILTPNSRFALRGLRPGRRFNGVPRAFGRTTRLRAAGRIWYLTDRGRIADLLEVHSGVIDEIGIADGRFLRTKPAAIRFLATFAAAGL